MMNYTQEIKKTKRLQRLSLFLLVIVLSILSLCAFSQPIIALESSRGFIRHNMAIDTLFSLSDASKYVLQYKCPQEGITVSYRFKIADPKICSDMMVDFRDSLQMATYLEQKLNSCKLMYVDDMRYRLNTDLFDNPICFEIETNKRLIIKYCELTEL